MTAAMASRNGRRRSNEVSDTGMGSARPVDVRPPIVELSLKVDLLRLARPSGKGAAFKALDDAEADTTTRSGKLLLGLLALTAEFETEIRKERQIEGIAKARLAGRSLGASSW